MPNEMTLEELLALAAQAQDAKEAVAQKSQPLTAESLAPLLADLKNTIEAGIDERVQKAFPRGEGSGPKGIINTEDPRDADPISYIVRKARKPEDLDQDDKNLIWALTEAALTENMK